MCNIMYNILILYILFIQLISFEDYTKNRSFYKMSVVFKMLKTIKFWYTRLRQNRS